MLAPQTDTVEHRSQIHTEVKIRGLGRCLNLISKDVSRTRSPKKRQTLTDRIERLSDVKKRLAAQLTTEAAA